MSRCRCLIQIEDRIVDAAILTDYFCCDLSACRGICCVDGSSGAPLAHDEVLAYTDHLEELIPLVPCRAQKALREEGAAYRDDDGEWVTTLVNDGECAFSFQENGVTLCAVERGYAAGQSPVSKPISCHLYPIRAERRDAMTLLRLDHWTICEPARVLGRKRGIRVYEFLRSALERAFGKEFYMLLLAAAERAQEEERRLQ